MVANVYVNEFLFVLMGWDSLIVHCSGKADASSFGCLCSLPGRRPQGFQWQVDAVSKCKLSLMIFSDSCNAVVSKFLVLIWAWDCMSGKFLDKLEQRVW